MVCASYFYPTLNDHVYHMLYDIILSRIFYVLPYISWFVTITITISSNVTDMQLSDVVTNPNPKF